jgi:hypothetical protein
MNRCARTTHTSHNFQTSSSGAQWDFVSANTTHPNNTHEHIHFQNFLRAQGSANERPQFDGTKKQQRGKKGANKHMRKNTETKPVLDEDVMPQGGFRGEEALPPGGFRGEEALPPGGFRAEELPPGGFRAL